MRSKLFAEKPKVLKIASGRWVKICPAGKDVYVLYDGLDGDAIGKLLFDNNDCWIYDGHLLTIAEQEEVAGYINSYQPEMDNLLKSLKPW
jgi:hypothetical protein